MDVSSIGAIWSIALSTFGENAVHHGIALSRSAASLDIEGQYQLGFWSIRISNTLCAPAQVVVEKGHALWSIRERLRLMRGTLTLEARDGAFHVLLKWKDPARMESAEIGELTAENLGHRDTGIRAASV